MRNKNAFVGETQASVFNQKPAKVLNKIILNGSPEKQSYLKTNGQIEGEIKH